MAARRLILGTAGHIDHGKTELVRALTGVCTDRLLEEKRRGISIDLGFARLDLGDCRLGIVDVPGHERFIRNMVAGASGIDLALLVVAADDSVMPQTREHLAILEFLGVRRGVVALTKIDRAEPSWADLVEQEVRELLAGTALAPVPIVRTSAATGAGLDALRRALAGACAGLEPRRSDTPFRLAVDRAFTVAGHGTVVTGTVSGGRVSVGDELAWLPRGAPVRVRGLQSFGAGVASAAVGERAALNLAGAHHRDIRRGHVLAAPGYLAPGRLLTVRLRLLPDGTRPLRHRRRVRLHMGTQEVTATVSLLEGDRLEPGGRGLAQLRCAEPVAAVARQPFVVRAGSPPVTIGGGLVLQPAARRVHRGDAETGRRAAALGSDDPQRRADAAAWLAGLEPLDALRLCREADLVPGQAAGFLEAGGSIVRLGGSPGGPALHRERLAELEARIVRTLRRLHAAQPLETAVPVETLSARLEHVDRGLVKAAVAHLRAGGALAGDDRAVALPDHEPVLTRAQRDLRRRLLEVYEGAGWEPPGHEALAARLGTTVERLRPVVELCAARRDLVHVGEDLYLHRAWASKLQQRLAEALRGSDGLTVSEIKTALGTTRKFAVPLCEYLDRAGVTRRRDDVRVLA